MNFDQPRKQTISRRPKPSPLRDAKCRPPSFDARFPQDVWPRLRKSAPSRQRTARSSAGFGIPLSWMQNLAIAAGVLVIGLVGTNWDSISRNFMKIEIDPQSLRDLGGSRFDDGIQIAGYLSPAVLTDIPLDLTEPFSWTDYPVRTGDTISGIATQFSISAESLIAFNNITEAWNIRIGTVLKVPNMNGIPYTVGKNDTLFGIAEKMKVPRNAILDANDITSDAIRPGDVLFIPGAHMDANEFSRAYRRDGGRALDRPMILPVGGRITSGFGWREDPVRPIPGDKRFHQGVDFAGKVGDPVKAAMKGTVLHRDNNPNLGDFVILKHDGGYQTLYAHLSAYSVVVGETVKQGQEIGKVGNTGYTTGPHLHFEAFRNGNRINPLDLLK